jgi:HD-GYP domain-containing protein (c-di-GMP phosphodiesterase class II)
VDLDIVQSLVKAIELKDRSTAAHTWRVVLYTRALAEQAGVEKALVERLCIGAALHDVGKIDIPDAILTKTSRLTDAEFDIIKTHTTLGHERLVRMGETDEHLLELVRSHHERWDGLGYPDGLAGESIALGPRFFAVIDSFDAMTSIRPYRNQIGEDAAEVALLELEAGKGTRYWPEAVDAFTDLYRSEQITWILHYFNDDVPVPDFGAPS